MTATRKICLVLEYDGTAYHGWQFQDNNRSIQEVLEEVLTRITGEHARVIGSGRTDAGVHALGQVAMFRTTSRIPGDEFCRAFNGLLPPDIRALASREVLPSFHPQFDASGKTYFYAILNRAAPSALLLNRCWHVRQPLDVGAMREAAAVLVGEHDFSAFRSSSCNARNPVRSIRRLEIIERGGLLELWCEGSGFLKNMVRNIAGTLVDVGRGRCTATGVAAVLASGDRRLAGPCAPPWGLYLVAVSYAGKEHLS